MVANTHAHLNAYVMNGRFGNRSLADDADRRTNSAKRSRYAYKTLYAPISDPVDFTIKRGELLWTRAGPGKYPLLNENQQPSVLSVLNGLTVRDANNGMKGFEDEIRVLGPSRKDVVFDSMNLHKPPSDDPVYMVACVTTMHNSGTETARPGDAMEWYLVEESLPILQINDGVTTFSRIRRTLGVRPLKLSCNVKETMAEDEGFKKVWTAFIKEEFKGAIEADHPVFDLMLRAMMEPIVEAYADHAGIATTGAGAGIRQDMAIGSQFLHMKIVGQRAYAGGSPVPPPGGGGGKGRRPGVEFSFNVDLSDIGLDPADTDWYLKEPSNIGKLFEAGTKKALTPPAEGELKQAMVDLVSANSWDLSDATKQTPYIKHAAAVSRAIIALDKINTAGTYDPSTKDEFKQLFYKLCYVYAVYGFELQNKGYDKATKDTLFDGAAYAIAIKHVSVNAPA